MAMYKTTKAANFEMSTGALVTLPAETSVYKEDYMGAGTWVIVTVHGDFGTSIVNEKDLKKI